MYETDEWYILYKEGVDYYNKYQANEKEIEKIKGVSDITKLTEKSALHLKNAKEKLLKSNATYINAFACRDLGIIDTNEDAKIQYYSMAVQRSEETDAKLQISEMIHLLTRVIGYYLNKQQKVEAAYYTALAANIYERVGFYNLAVQNWQTAANWYFDTGRVRDTVRNLEKCMKYNPDYFTMNLTAHTYGIWGDLDKCLLFAQLALEDMNAVLDGKKIDSARENNMNPLLLNSNLIFNLNYVNTPKDDLYKYHIDYMDKYDIEKLKLKPPISNKIRVGYMSGDMGGHQVSHMMDWAFKYANKDEFDIFLYSIKGDDESIGDRFRIEGVTCRCIGKSKSDEEYAKIISEDNIDIFVEMMGHTAHNRSLILKYKPAPIIVSYLGYPNTLGTDCVDYKFTDKYLIDPEDIIETDGIISKVKYYSEKTYNLPYGIHCYIPTEVFVPNHKPSDHIRYGTFNQPRKFCDRYVDAVAHILSINKTATFTVRYYYLNDALVRDHVHEKFEKRGIERSRIDLNYCYDKKDYIETYNNIDLVLDAFPYNGHSTACEALWMDVPILVLKGNQYASRVGYSMCKHLGLDEYICNNIDEFVSKAVMFKNDTPGRIRSLIEKHPMSDQAKFAKSVENAYHDMVYIHSKTSEYKDIFLKKSKHSTSLLEVAKSYEESGLKEEARRCYLELVQKEESEEVLMKLSELDDKPKWMYRRAVKYYNPDLMCTAGYWYISRRDIAKAIECYCRALVPGVDNYLPFNGLAESFGYMGNTAMRIYYTNIAWQILNEFDMKRKIISDPSPSMLSNLCFYSLYDETKSLDEIFNTHRLWNQKYASQETVYPNILRHNRELLLHVVSPRRIRVGFLGSDLYDHPMGRSLVFLPYISKFDVFVYNADKYSDYLHQWFKTALPNWRNIANLGNTELINMLIADRLDILIDISGHSAGGYLRVFSVKPAPLTITYLAYPYTTGLLNMDIKLTDKYLTTENDQKYFTESLYELDGGIHCYKPMLGVETLYTINRESSDHVRFGSFNNLAKLSDAYIDAVCKILLDIPTATFMMRSNYLEVEYVQESMIYKFTKRGIAANRLDFNSSATKNSYINDYNKVDLVLDPWPYGGHTTTCEALWMGVPCLTIRGKSMWGRVATSILTHLNMTQYICEDVEEYIRKAREFNPSTINHKSIQDNIYNSIIGNAEKYANMFEDSILDIWQKFTLGIRMQIPPETVKLEESNVDLGIEIPNVSVKEIKSKNKFIKKKTEEVQEAVPLTEPIKMNSDLEKLLSGNNIIEKRRPILIMPNEDARSRVTEIGDFIDELIS